MPHSITYILTYLVAHTRTHTHSQKFANNNNLVVFETSAKEDINVELAVMTLVAMMKERRENGTDQEEEDATKKQETKCSLQ